MQNSQYDIVKCQQGGVSNKPPGPQAATRHEASDRAKLVILPKILKRGTDSTLDPFYMFY